MNSRRQRRRRRRRSVFWSGRTCPLRARRRLCGLYLYTTALLLVALKRQLYQAGDEVAVGEALVLPELGVHAHRREAGDRVDLVEPQAVVRGEEEVHAGQAGAVDRRVGGEGHGARGFRRLGRDVGRDVELCFRVLVLCVVVVELTLENY